MIPLSQGALSNLLDLGEFTWTQFGPEHALIDLDEVCTMRSNKRTPVMLKLDIFMVKIVIV